MGVRLDKIEYTYLKEIFESNYLDNKTKSKEVTIISLDLEYNKFVLNNNLDKNKEIVFKLFKIIIELVFLIYCYISQQEEKDIPYEDLLVDELGYDPTGDLYAMLEHEYDQIKKNYKSNIEEDVTFKQCYHYLFEFNNVIEEIISYDCENISLLVIDWGDVDNVWCALICGSNIDLLESRYE